MAKEENLEYTHWENVFRGLVDKYKGYVNSHAHLDRADTTEKTYLEHASMDPIEASAYPMTVKQNLTGDLHRGVAYSKEDLEKRLRRMLDMSIHFKTREIWSLIDTTDDEAKEALDSALKIGKEYSDRIVSRWAAYPIFGFKDSIPGRWNIFKEAAEKADFIAALPERDTENGRVGYDEHLRRIILTGRELKKEVHVHVDQANDGRENGTETLIEAVRWLWPESYKNLDEPKVWSIHSISPSCYDENRFQKLLGNVKKYNLGLIVCPGAAVGMRQLRPLVTPTHNSIARVKDYVADGIPVRFGSDNIGDVFMPSGHPDMFRQIWRLTDDIRFYHPSVLAKLACGVKLNDMDKDIVKRAIEEDKKIFNKILGKLE